MALIQKLLFPEPMTVRASASAPWLRELRIMDRVPAHVCAILDRVNQSSLYRDLCRAALQDRGAAGAFREYLLEQGIADEDIDAVLWFHGLRNGPSSREIAESLGMTDESVLFWLDHTDVTGVDELGKLRPRHEADTNEEAVVDIPF